jgi:hypothetical protein
MYTARSIRRGLTQPFLIVFDSFGSDSITAVFHRIVNKRKRSDTPFSGRLRHLQNSKKKGILLLSETLLGFPNGSETPKKVFKWLGNPKRVSDSNKIPFF